VLTTVVPLLLFVAVNGHQVVNTVVMSVTVVLSGTELKAEVLKGRTTELLTSVALVVSDDAIGMTVVTVERLEYVLSTVVPLLVSVVVKGHQVVKTVVTSVTVAFPAEPILVVDTPDTLTAVELPPVPDVVDVLVYHAEVAYAEDV
jgi:hypothetical protein